MKNVKKILSMMLALMLVLASVAIADDVQNSNVEDVAVIEIEVGSDAVEPESGSDAVEPESGSDAVEPESGSDAVEPETPVVPEVPVAPETTDVPYVPETMDISTLMQPAVVVDGVAVVFEDVPAIIIDGRTYVPVRKIAEIINAKVAWRAFDSTVHIFTTETVDGKDVGVSRMVKIGEAKVYKNNYAVKPDFVYTTPAEEIALLNAPRLINSRTMVPVRALAEVIGAKVDWDEANSTVIIASNPNTQKTADDATAAYLIESWQSVPEYKVVTGSIAIDISENVAGADASVGSNVTVKIGDKTATTDAEGKATIAEIDEGNYTIEVTVDGYKVQNPDRLNVSVKAGEETNVVIYVEKEAIEETEVEVAE